MKIPQVSRNTVVMTITIIIIGFVVYLATTDPSYKLVKSIDKAKIEYSKIADQRAELQEQIAALEEDLLCQECIAYHNRVMLCQKHHKTDYCQEAYDTADRLINTWFGEIYGICYSGCINSALYPGDNELTMLY